MENTSLTNEQKLDKLRALLNKNKKKKPKSQYRVPLNRKYTQEYRTQRIMACIEEMQPKASFQRILLCCREYYRLDGIDCNMDLFSDLHDLVEEGKLVKRYESNGSKRDVFYSQQ